MSHPPPPPRTSDSPPVSEDLRSTYQQRLASAESLAERYDRRGAVLGVGRLALLASLAVAALATHDNWARSGVTWSITLAIAFVTWWLQNTADDRRDRARGTARLNARLLARLDGDTDGDPGDDLLPESHPYAADLDLFGEGGLFPRLELSRTTAGREQLAAWLLSPATPETVTERWAAVDRLAPAHDARERLLASADGAILDLGALQQWARSPAPWMPGLAWRVTAVALPAFLILIVVLGQLALIPTAWALIPAAAALLVRRAAMPRIAPLLAASEQLERRVAPLRPVMTEASAQPTDDALLKRTHEELTGAVEAIDHLRRHVTLLQSRANLMVALIAPFLLWELNAGWGLARWHRRHAARVTRWLEALGTLEALHAIAAWTTAHPDDARPTFVAEPTRFSATALGHPLLPPSSCVRNDLTLDGPGAALLVTGSNMSGKSTLLRACGLAAVMAQAGLPTRAASVSMSPLQPGCVMRVSDDLRQGTSLFLAEVRRLKATFDLTTGERPLLFLLDEILQGTNSHERRLGARAVVAALRDRGAIGLVSTHDLALAAPESNESRPLACAHFTDEEQDGEMRFDYRMRPGVSTTTNALRVMAAQGLPVGPHAVADGDPS